MISRLARRFYSSKPKIPIHIQDFVDKRINAQTFDSFFMKKVIDLTIDILLMISLR